VAQAPVTTDSVVSDPSQTSTDATLVAVPSDSSPIAVATDATPTDPVPTDAVVADLNLVAASQNTTNSGSPDSQPSMDITTPVSALDALFAAGDSGVTDASSMPAATTLDALFAGADPNTIAPVYLV
jgi:hypothetical protein